MLDAGSSRSCVSFCRNNQTTITALTLQDAGRGNSHASGILIAPFPERLFGPKQTGWRRREAEASWLLIGCSHLCCVQVRLGSPVAVSV